MSKLTDADGEVQETLHWLTTAGDCGYIIPLDLGPLEEGFGDVGKMLGAMMAKHEKFCLR